MIFLFIVASHMYCGLNNYFAMTYQVNDKYAFFSGLLLSFDGSPEWLSFAIHLFLWLVLSQSRWEVSRKGIFGYLGFLWFEDLPVFTIINLFHFFHFIRRVHSFLDSFFL